MNDLEWITVRKQNGIGTVLENILTQKYEIFKVQGTL